MPILKSIGIDPFARWYHFTGVEFVSVPFSSLLNDNFKIEIGFEINDISGFIDFLHYGFSTSGVEGLTLQHYNVAGFGLRLKVDNLSTESELVLEPGIIYNVVIEKIAGQPYRVYLNDVLVITTISTAPVTMGSNTYLVSGIGSAGTTFKRGNKDIYYSRIENKAIYNNDEFEGLVSFDSSGNDNDGTIDLGGSSEASFFSGT